MLINVSPKTVDYIANVCSIEDLVFYSSFISPCPSMKVAEKKLEELPKNAGVHFLIYWRWTFLDTVGNVLSYYENQITLDVQM